MALPIRSNTWSQIANEQAYNEATTAKLNATDLIVNFDPIYGKLVEQISRTIYHKLQVTQKWRAIGTTLGTNEYPGVIREIAMRQRKGMNYPMDADVRPTTLLNYDIINDEIDVRYHSAQFRWMYGYTIFDEELRRFSGGNGVMIGELTEMKQINTISARNRFMDLLRKKVLSLYAQNIAKEYITNVDITNFNTLTTDQAKEWLNAMDALIFLLDVGTELYNGTGYFIQTPASRLQMIMPRAYYMNVIRRAFPDTYNTYSFERILPENLILIDDMGDAKLMNAEGTAELTPTFDAKGMNLLNWSTGNTVEPRNPNLQAIIMDRGALGFEDNLNEVLIGTKDIEKLATPVRTHFWTKAWMTDILTGLKVVYQAPTGV